MIRLKLDPRWPMASLGPMVVLSLGLLMHGSRADDPPKQTKALPSTPVSVQEPPSDQEAIAKKKEHCSVDPDQLALIGSAKGRQVRIYRDETDFAVFTVAETHDETPDSIVRVGKLGRLRMGPSEPFEGRMTPMIARSDLTDEQARARGELVEHLVDDGTNNGLIVMAPHGGMLEPSTDLQALRVLEQLKGRRVSTWLCKGYHPRGGKAAFDRWHITSGDISEASYPLLGKVATRKYEYAVSFHGMVDDRILIGGSAPMRLKREIQESIRTALGDARIVVDIAQASDANNGIGPRNIVNRYVEPGGVQIEQSARARRDHWKAIADAVAQVYASKL